VVGVKMKKYIYIILVGLLLTSCLDFTSPDRYTKKLYYLTGLLNQGSTITLENPVLLGKTIPAEGATLEDLFIMDADVKVYEYNRENQLTNSVQLDFSYDPDPEDEKWGYVDLEGLMVIQSGFRYEIIAINEQDTISASTVVPETISVLPDPTGYTDDPEDEPYPEMVYDYVDRDHPIQIQTVDNEVFPLYAEFYCLEEWYEAEWVRPFNSDYPEDEEEYENPSNGSPRKIVSFYPFQPVNNLVNYQFYQSAFVFYGRYEVIINAIDDNYYHYLYKPEGYNHGGINGGIGYFGSVSGKKMYTNIVEEESEILVKSF